MYLYINIYIYISIYIYIDIYIYIYIHEIDQLVDQLFQTAAFTLKIYFLFWTTICNLLPRGLRLGGDLFSATLNYIYFKDPKFARFYLLPIIFNFFSSSRCFKLLSV